MGRAGPPGGFRIGRRSNPPPDLDPGQAVVDVGRLAPPRNLPPPPGRDNVELPP